MAFNLTAGNPRAHRIRVYYFGTSTIYEGMPVCYDNSTTNWFGGYVTTTQGASCGEVTASTTTAEGSYNEGKYIRVENPNADNISLFAGVVAKGGWVGKTGPRALDIYVPNGAVVPVRTDSNCLIDQTILAITTGSQELGVPLATDSRPVAIARETIDRGTAGLVLAELNPDKFLHQDMGGTALSVDDADTTTSTLVNYSNINFLGSSVYNRCLYMVGTLNAGAALNGMFKFRTYVTHTPTSLVQAVCANLHFQGDDAKTRGGNGEICSALFVTVETEDTTAADLSAGDVACVQCCSYIDDGCTTPGKIQGLFFHSNSATYHNFTHLFGCRHLDDFSAYASTGDAPALATGDIMIPVNIAGTTYYLVALADTGV
jgi:hypothetical protein